MRELIIDGRKIGDDQPAYIIADIGHNHGGDLNKAYEMIISASQSGVDAVKFQTRNPKEVYSTTEYNRTSDNPQWMNTTYGKHREALEPSQEQWSLIFNKCRDVGITAFSTPFDFKSVDLLESLDVPAYKIASGDATNIPMMEYIAEIGKPMIVSTGGCTMSDVRRIHKTLTNKNVPFAILQCSCVYPCPPEAVNLSVIDTYRREFPCTVTGLSTHNPNYIPTLAAYALGGRIFEHHYTNNRSWKGTDNRFSLTPKMMRGLYNDLEQIRKAHGSAHKSPMPIEISPTIERRKKLISARDITQGSPIVKEDIAIKCPGDGIPPYELPNILGMLAKRHIGPDEDIDKRDLEIAKITQ